MAENNGIELRGNPGFGFKYYDGQVMYLTNDKSYYQIIFDNSDSGFHTKKISLDDAKRISNENFSKLGISYDMKTGKSPDGVNLGFIRIPEDKKSESNINLAPTKADLSILEAQPKQTETPASVSETKPESETIKPVEDKSVEDKPTENKDAQMAAIERRVTTPVEEKTIEKNKVLEAYKRNIPEQKAPIEYTKRLNLEKVPEYNYDLTKQPMPLSSDKMWEMAIARRAANGSQLPASKFNGGKYGYV